MDLTDVTKLDEVTWRIERRGAMRVPAIVYADEALIRDMDDNVAEQACNDAMLPGIVGASYVMPDAHWGYGFPIAGVAAFDPDQGGVVSAGGVGFDISCGVGTMTTGITLAEIEQVKHALADSLMRAIPAGVGSEGTITLDAGEMDAMLAGGAAWAVARGWGDAADLERVEKGGCMQGARPDHVSHRARARQRCEMGTLGSGNHYLEVQVVEEIFDPVAAKAFGLALGQVVITIHCGSRGLGHQIGSEFLKEMVASAEACLTAAQPEAQWIMAPDGNPTLPQLHSCGGSVSGTGSMPSSWRIWANFAGSASRRSAIIARSAVRPASVKNSLGRRCPVSSRINPRSSKLAAAGESFGLPASGPPRQVLSWKPSDTLGRVEKKLSSSRRMYSRSRGVKVATATLGILLMRLMLARSAARPAHLARARRYLPS